MKIRELIDWASKQDPDSDFRIWVDWGDQELVEDGYVTWEHILGPPKPVDDELDGDLNTCISLIPNSIHSLTAERLEWATNEKP